MGLGISDWRSGINYSTHLVVRYAIANTPYSLLCAVAPRRARPDGRGANITHYPLPTTHYSLLCAIPTVIRTTRTLTRFYAPRYSCATLRIRACAYAPLC